MSRITVQLDELRLAVGEVEALAALLLEFYDGADWTGAADQLLVERVGHVLGVLATSATSAASKLDRFHAAVTDTQPAPAGERGTDDGTAPGGQVAMSAQDAEIVRRLRERCPDNRFDGGSDVELIELFKRNKRVLDRSDEDVIAAMTHPR